MTENKTASAESRVWRPCTRAFFVYYVAMAIAFFGPLINPAVGVPVWLGWLVGLLIAVGVAYHLFGQEYRATPRGLMKVWRWPPQEELLPWENVGAVTIRRGLTQTLLQVGNVVVSRRQGGEEMFWYGLTHPKEVKAALEEMRP
ncbi:MAG: hypothetical protein FJ128_00380 [Deltaproteobacteria bacterium]|nr:hypothetical protein [Deltaproteobacteria bacterium]